MIGFLYALFFNLYMIISLSAFQVSFGVDDFWAKVALTSPLALGLTALGFQVWDIRQAIAKLEEANSTPTIRE